MHNFVRYTTFPTTHEFVPWWHFFYWGGNNERNVESLIMILFSAYLDSLSPPSTRSLTRLLWSSWTYIFSNIFGTSYGLLWPSMFTFRQSLKIGDHTTCGLCMIQFQRDFSIWSFIFEFPFHFSPMAMVYFHI